MYELTWPLANFQLKFVEKELNIQLYCMTERSVDEEDEDTGKKQKDWNLCYLWYESAFIVALFGFIYSIPYHLISTSSTSSYFQCIHFLLSEHFAFLFLWDFFSSFCLFFFLFLYDGLPSSKIGFSFVLCVCTPPFPSSFFHSLSSRFVWRKENCKREYNCEGKESITRNCHLPQRQKHRGGMNIKLEKLTKRHTYAHLYIIVWSYLRAALGIKFSILLGRWIKA